MNWHRAIHSRVICTTFTSAVGIQFCFFFYFSKVSRRAGLTKKSLAASPKPIKVYLGSAFAQLTSMKDF